jgi:hypothetical protein
MESRLHLGRKIAHVTTAVCITIGTQAIGGNNEAFAYGDDSLPAGCSVAPIGSYVLKSAEQGLKDIGYTGIKPDGKITDADEQLRVLRAQRDLQKWGFIDSKVKICGIAGNQTKNATDAVKNQDDLGSDSDDDDKAKLECKYNVMTKREVERLLSLGGSNSDEAVCEAILQFQATSGLAVDGIVGKQTGLSLIKNANNPCSIYGSSVEDCFVGVQIKDNLGRAFIIEDGEIIKEMEARFGNPSKNGGKKTPEGSFSITGSIEGEHISTNCVDENGNGYVCMWNTLYFKGGIGVHGTKNPTNPNGSLGCVGISIANSEFLYVQFENNKIKKIVIIDFNRPEYKQS